MQSIICSGNISTAQPPQARLGAGITLTLSEQQIPSLKNNNKSKVSTFVLRKPRSGPIHYMHWVSGALDTLHEEQVQCSFSKTFYFLKSPIFPQGRFWWVLSFFQNKTPWTWPSRKSRHSQPVFANHFSNPFPSTATRLPIHRSSRHHLPDQTILSNPFYFWKQKHNCWDHAITRPSLWTQLFEKI